VTSAAAFLVWVGLLAGIPFALVVTTLAGVDTDVRAAGSGNPGATNVARLFGWRLAAPVLTADIAKGFVPVVMARLLWPAWDPTFAWVVAIVAFLGHCFSVFLEFRGGKGVATAAGGLLAITPFPTLLAAIAWVLVLWLSGRSSVASLTAATALVVLCALLDPASLPLVICVAAGIAITHTANVRRLIAGREGPVIRPVSWGKPADRVDPSDLLSQGPAGGAAPPLWKERERDPLD
jgi:acyl phosphate:glycerol-3-phosphate acyltransferase